MLTSILTCLDSTRPKTPLVQRSVAIAGGGEVPGFNLRESLVLNQDAWRQSMSQWSISQNGGVITNVSWIGAPNYSGPIGIYGMTKGCARRSLSMAVPTVR